MNENQLSSATKAIQWSVATSFFLAVLKLITGIFTHSMAIFASALDSAMDMTISFVNLIAAKEAAKPPDEDHAYGHGKIESLASLFQSILIGLSGLFLTFEAVRRLIVGTSLRSIPLGIAVTLVSMMASTILARVLQATARKNKSLILSTEALHYSTDVITHAGTVIALLLVHFTRLPIWDLALSIGVSLYIFKASYKIFRQAVDELLDRSLPAVSKEDIETIIRQFSPSVVGIHNFRSRQVGPQIFLDFHIEIRGEDDFKRAHTMTESIIQRIQDHYPGADVTVHFDPEGEM